MWLVKVVYHAHAHLVLPRFADGLGKSDIGGCALFYTNQRRFRVDDARESSMQHPGSNPYCNIGYLTSTSLLGNTNLML